MSSILPTKKHIQPKSLEDWKHTGHTTRLPIYGLSIHSQSLSLHFAEVQNWILFLTIHFVFTLSILLTLYCQKLHFVSSKSGILLQKLQYTKLASSLWSPYIFSWSSLPTAVNSFASISHKSIQGFWREHAY